VKVLALETSTLAGGAALVDGDRLVGESTLNIRATHSERVLVVVDRLLADAGWRPSDLEGLAVSIGPGSFTGLRIGVGTAKGLALALRLAVAPVPTLDALAAALPWSALPVCPVLDARQGEVYASLYRWDGASMRREWDYLALTPAELAARLTEPVVLLGARLAPLARRFPSPACVAQLGQELLARGAGRPPAEIVPLYLRPSEAELKRRRALALA